MQEISQPQQPLYIVKKRRIWPWVIGSIIAALLVGALLISLAVNVALVKGKVDAKPVKLGQRRFSEVLLEGKGEDKIVIIPVKGLISFADPESFWERESMVSRVLDRLKAAEDDPAVKAVILEIDSPGGGITASDIIHHRIKQFQAFGKKVVASLGDLATSGAYYVACPADLIIAHPTTITGNIGVIIQSFNLEGLMTKIGLRDVTIKAGDQKDLLSPFRTLTPEERELLQEVVDEMFYRFVSVIAEGRNLDEEQVEEFADGRIFTGNQALSIGLVDKIGYQDEAIKLARELAGLEEARVVKYKRTLSLWELFRSRSQKFFLRSHTFHLQQLLQPATPRLMYLWTL